MRTAICNLLVGVIGVCLALPAVADEVVVRAPFVNVRVGSRSTPERGVEVSAPFTHVVVPSARPATRSFAAEPLKAPKGSEGDAVPAVSVVDFIHSFKPAPGTYEVVLLHPCTGCPVKVCFTLPDCCLKKVRLTKKEMAWNYGHCEVEIHFKKDGRLVVDYDGRF